MRYFVNWLIDNLPLLALIASILGGIGGMVPIFHLLTRKHRIKLKEIRQKNDDDVEGFKLLYLERVCSNIAVSSEIIIRYIEDPLHTLCVAKKKNDIVGFVKLIELTDSELLYLPYICVSKDIQKRKKVSATLIKYTIRHGKKKRLKGIVFEIEGSSLQHSLKRKFHKHGLSVYICKPYKAPSMEDERGNITNVFKEDLMIVPFNDINDLDIKKAVHSIYNQVYIPCHPKREKTIKATMDSFISKIKPVKFD